MKTFSIFLVSLFGALSFSLIAQVHWDPMLVTGLPGSQNPTLIFSAVDANICWGVQSYDVTLVMNPKFVLTTDSGTNWTVSDVGIPSGLGVQSIYALNAQTAWIAVDDPNNGSGSGIYKTINSGAVWNKQGSAFSQPNGHPRSIYFFDANNGICVGNPTNGFWEIYTTTDGGSNWSQVNSSILASSGDRTFHPTYSASGNNFWFGTAFRYVYRTTDRGTTWTVTTNAFNNSGVGVDVEMVDSQIGLACTYFGDHINRTYKTNDGGGTWSNLQNPPLVPSFKHLSYVPGSNGAIYVAVAPANIGYSEPTDPGSAYTLDGGLTWTQIDNLPHGPASFSQDGWGWSGGVGNIIYRIFRGSIPVELISFNSSVVGNSIQLTWQTATETNNQGFEIYRNGNRIAFVGGKGTTTERQDYSFTDKNLQPGIYNYRLNQLDFNGTQKVVGELTVYLSLPEKFALEQNFPNPFNPSTKISWQSPVGSWQTLKVYDVLGNEVATLVDEYKPTGSYEVEFNAAGLTSGIYFYSLQAGSFVQTKKLILIK